MNEQCEAAGGIRCLGKLCQEILSSEAGAVFYLKAIVPEVFSIADLKSLIRVKRISKISKNYQNGLVVIGEKRYLKNIKGLHIFKENRVKSQILAAGLLQEDHFLP